MKLSVKTVRGLWIADVTITFIATLLFKVQHGFGGGHLSFDGALAFLALPWILVPWPEWFNWASDYIWLILIPFLLNSSIVAIIHLLSRHSGMLPP